MFTDPFWSENWIFLRLINCSNILSLFVEENSKIMKVLLELATKINMVEIIHVKKNLSDNMVLPLALALFD